MVTYLISFTIQFSKSFLPDNNKSQIKETMKRCLPTSLVLLYKQFSKSFLPDNNKSQIKETMKRCLPTSLVLLYKQFSKSFLPDNNKSQTETVFCLILSCCLSRALLQRNVPNKQLYACDANFN